MEVELQVPLPGFATLPHVAVFLCTRRAWAQRAGRGPGAAPGAARAESTASGRQATTPGRGTLRSKRHEHETHCDAFSLSWPLTSSSILFREVERPGSALQSPS